MTNVNDTQTDAQCNDILKTRRSDICADKKICKNVKGKQSARSETKKVQEDKCNAYKSNIARNQLNGENIREENKDAIDEESDYDTESFCSDDSFKESEVTNVTPRSSLSNCSSLLPTFGSGRTTRDASIGLRCMAHDRHSHSFDDDDDDICLLENDMKYLRTCDSRLDQRRMQNGRKNMSFTNAQMREIERENQILLRKIMSYQKPINKPVKIKAAQPRASSSEINRRRLQKKIEEGNMMLLRKIQGAKSWALPKNTSGCRPTML
ncbi:cilia- and flagella-associated protein 97-like [Orussus abietinus]|uniref:cilia- and flagella-associated protein 97-like n=1 Tax=Orussus abietinus TaxID=222816 RepID=UPI00062557A5|nr:cilia- and flagella-associated protein 97-like [Orussus abietinus]